MIGSDLQLHILPALYYSYITRVARPLCFASKADLSTTAMAFFLNKVGSRII